MREFSKVGCSVWQSRKFRGLKKDDDARYLYLYLLTNPHSNSSGCYTLSEGYVSADLEWDVDRYRKAIESLSKARLVKVDLEVETVFVINWVRFNEPMNARHSIGILTQLHEASSDTLKAERFQEYESAILERKFTSDRTHGAALESVLKAFRDSIDIPDQDQDKTEKESRPDRDKTKPETRVAQSPGRACAKGAALPAQEIIPSHFQTPFLKGAA